MKFGFDQIGKPTPPWMSKVMNALIVIVMPALATLIIAIPDSWISAEVKNFMGAISTFFIAMIRGLMFLFGINEETPNE